MRRLRWKCSSTRASSWLISQSPRLVAPTTTVIIVAEIAQGTLIAETTAIATTAVDQGRGVRLTRIRLPFLTRSPRKKRKKKSLTARRARLVLVRAARVLAQLALEFSTVVSENAGPAPPARSASIDTCPAGEFIAQIRSATATRDAAAPGMAETRTKTLRAASVNTIATTDTPAAAVTVEVWIVEILGGSEAAVPSAATGMIGGTAVTLEIETTVATEIVIVIGTAIGMTEETVIEIEIAAVMATGRTDETATETETVMIAEIGIGTETGTAIGATVTVIGTETETATAIGTGTGRRSATAASVTLTATSLAGAAVGVTRYRDTQPTQTT